MAEIHSSTPTPSAAPADAPPDPMSSLKVLGAWLFVGIPAAWGVFQTLKKALDLFK